MQIGPMPVGPDNVMFRRQDAGVRAAVPASPTPIPLNTGLPDTKPADIRTTTDELEHISLAMNRRLKFIVDHESREVIVKVIDPETDKVIKVLPPEELQRLHQRIRETIGLLFDQRV